MLRVLVRGSGLVTMALGPGETLLIGRQPQGFLPAEDPRAQLRFQAMTLPGCADHVSRLVGEIAVGEEVVRLRWRGSTEAALSSLFDAPGGARRVTLAAGMTALLDEGDNHILVLRGRSSGPERYTDILLSVLVEQVVSPPPHADLAADPDGAVTGTAPALFPRSKEWFVALALAEPWLTGSDDYPRPPSNREIYERVLAWHGYAWNLKSPQRVDDALRTIARVAFGPQHDPFASNDSGRAQNIRFAIARRACEVRLITSEDLEKVEREARARESGTFRFSPPPG